MDISVHVWGRFLFIQPGIIWKLYFSPLTVFYSMTPWVYIAVSIHGAYTVLEHKRPSGTVLKNLRAKTKPGIVLPVMSMERHLLGNVPPQLHSCCIAGEAACFTWHITCEQTNSDAVMMVQALTGDWRAKLWPYNLFWCCSGSLACSWKST